MPLYKYLNNPTHAESLVRDGTVRVGTLHGYREWEHADLERRDAEEGRVELHSNREPTVYNSTGELPPVLRGQSFRVGVGGLFTNNENAFRLESDGPDLLVYCVSERFDDALLAALGLACVEITDPVRFFRGLDAALQVEFEGRGTVSHLGVGACCYAGRRFNWHTEGPAPWWLLKPGEYRHQSEVRAAWQLSLAPAPVFVKSSEIAASCTLRR